MKYFLFAVLSLISYVLPAQDIPDPMSPPRMVNDFANVFTSEEKNSLESILRNYNDSTSTQIYVVTVDDLQGYAISDYAFRIGEKWKIGQKGKDNGAVILIKPKKGNSRGDVFIAVGYGLEAKLNDARIGRILDSEMIPYFKQDNYYGGVKSSVFEMIKYLSGEYSNDEAEEEGSLGFLEIIGIIILIILISTRRGRIFLFFLLSILGKSGGGSSGGGFGGGGGGRFGGGGAGRSW